MMAARRPLRADAARNRAQLLEVAKEVFAEEGLEVPIDHVAKRAGLGIGTVYRHFPTKEALFEAIVLDQLEGLLELGEALQHEKDPERALVQYLEGYMAAGAAKRDFIEALRGMGRGPTPPPAIGSVFKQIREHVARLLTRAQKAGRIRPDVGVDEVLALLHGVSAAKASYAGAAENRLWQVVLSGLRTVTG